MRRDYPETVRICSAHARPSCAECLSKAIWFDMAAFRKEDAAAAIYQVFANPVPAGSDCCWIGDKECPEHGHAYR